MHVRTPEQGFWLVVQLLCLYAPALFMGLACWGVQQCLSSYLLLGTHHVMSAALKVALQHLLVRSEHPVEAATATMHV